MSSYYLVRFAIFSACLMKKSKQSNEIKWRLCKNVDGEAPPLCRASVSQQPCVLLLGYFKKGFRKHMMEDLNEIENSDIYPKTLKQVLHLLNSVFY